MRPDNRCTRDLERMSCSVVRGVGEVNEHSKSEGSITISIFSSTGQ